MRTGGLGLGEMLASRSRPDEESRGNGFVIVTSGGVRGAELVGGPGLNGLPTYRFRLRLLARWLKAEPAAVLLDLPVDPLRSTFDAALAARELVRRPGISITPSHSSTDDFTRDPPELLDRWLQCSRFEF